MPLRTGMTTIGIPGSKLGLQKEDLTLAEALKTQGYATGQFGKNHLGDRNEFLPTVHGFDEWYGNLYHLNAEEEPEQLAYPGQKHPEYKAKYAPRGVMHTWATSVDDRTEDPVFGRVGKQKIENTGPLTRKRMETFDGEVLDVTLKYMDKVGKDDKPFFIWFNTTATHIWSHSPQKYIQMAVDEGRPESDVARAKMLEHDEQVGVLLNKLKELGVDDNTIVIYSTDNGAELMMWPDAGYMPFRGEKGTTWEGGFRVPMLAKWPGHIAAGSEFNGVQSHEDLFATLAAAAGMPNLKTELLTGKKMGDMTYKVHLDGYNLMPALKGEAEWPRKEFLYWTDDGSIAALQIGRASCRERV
jgi:arylsulfatase